MWNLSPDQSIFVSGGTTKRQILDLSARYKDELRLMAYLDSKASFSLAMNKVTAGSKLKTVWFDSRTGDSISAGSFPNQGDQSFSTPAEWEDARLMIEPES